MDKGGFFMTDFLFDQVIDRTQDGAGKWLLMHQSNPQVAQGVVPLSVADCDMPISPAISQGLARFVQTTIPGYTRIRQEYKQAVIDWNFRMHQWTIDPDWIVTSPGVVPALYTAIKAYTQPQDAVLIMSPVYNPFATSVKRLGRTLYESQLINAFPSYQIDFQDLESYMARPETKLLLLCSPHNPVGRVWTRQELEKIVELALRHHVLIVSDEIHSDLIFKGHQHHVLASIHPEILDHCLICTAPSKSFNIAGYQASSIMIPNPLLRERFVHVQEAQGFEGINLVGQEATRLAYTQAFDWFQSFLELIQENHRFLKDYLAHHLPQVRAYDMEGTFLQWLDCRDLGYSAEDLNYKLTQEAQVFFSDGRAFSSTAAGFQRVNLACPQSVLEETLDRFCRCFQ